MRWFIDLPTRVKLAGSFGFVIVLMAVATVTASIGVTRIQASERSLSDHDFALALDYLTLSSTLNREWSELQEMILATSRSDQEALASDLKARDQEVEGLFKRLADAAQGDPGSLTKLGRIETLWSDWQGTRDNQEIPYIYAGKMQEATALSSGIQKERSETMTSLAKDLSDGERQRVQSRVAQAEADSAKTVTVLILLGLVGLLAAVGMELSLNLVIAKPLKRACAAIEAIAAGDLTIDLPADDRKDEIGQLIQMLRRMTHNLREQIRGAREGILVLASSASEIAAASTQVATGAAETATSVSETATSVEEVKQTAEVSNQQAKYVSESARKAAQISQVGKKAAGDTIAIMNRIRGQMESIAESVVRVSERSQAIGDIIASVDDLAEQSNLLAVNGAIEAAKAGKQGKGFAVVAQEIKSLAEQSKQATAQVRSVLSDTQKVTSASVMVTEQGSKLVEDGVKQATQAGESIDMLADSVAEAAQAAIQIAASSQQQLVGMDQVAMAMESINQASVQNLASTRQAEVAARTVEDLGQKLKRLIEKYKV